jgi:CheY-like chemotaxis protein
MSPIRILVVDDNEMNLTLVSKILEMDRYEIITAKNGLQAIQSVIKSMPDIAILDVMMPDMNGFDLCRKLRQPPLNATMPIIMLTAMNLDTEKERARQAGANEVWSKPFDMDLFRRRLRELLNPKTVS